jgi:hypothetical protein
MRSHMLHFQIKDPFLGKIHPFFAPLFKPTNNFSPVISKDLYDIFNNSIPAHMEIDPLSEVIWNSYLYHFLKKKEKTSSLDFQIIH